MKATYLQLASALALTFGIAACSPAAKTGVIALPQPGFVDYVVRESVLALPAAPDGEDWMDAALTPGAWDYVLIGDDGVGFARFGTAPSERRFMMECTRGKVLLGVIGDRTRGRIRMMRVTTETLSRTFETDYWGGMHAVFLPPADPVLDAMALSKGRFAVEVAGEPPLYLPSHAEVSRVIEDCR